MILISDKTIQNTIYFPSNSGEDVSTLILYSELTHYSYRFEIECSVKGAYYVVELLLEDVADGEYKYQLLNGEAVVESGQLRIGEECIGDVIYGYQETYTTYDPCTGRDEEIPYTDCAEEVDRAYRRGKADQKEEDELKLTNLTVNENGTYTAPFGYKNVVVDVPTTEPAKLQEKTVVVEDEITYVLADTGYDGLSKVTVDSSRYGDSRYMDGYLEGVEDGMQDQKDLLVDLTVTSNGTYQKEDGYKKVIVNVPVKKIEASKSVVATDKITTVSPSTGYDGIAKVTVDATQYGQNRYDEGVASGKTAGKQEQAAADLAKLTTLNVTSNGTYTAPYGYSRVNVNIPLANCDDYIIYTTTDGNPIELNNPTSDTMHTYEAGIGIIRGYNLSKGENPLGAFENETTLKTLVLGPAYTFTGGNCFTNCNNLEEISLAVSGTIGYNIFAGNYKLDHIVIKSEKAPAVQPNAFKDVAEVGVLDYPAGSDYSNWFAELPIGWSGTNYIKYKTTDGSLVQPTNSLGWGANITKNISYKDSYNYLFFDAAPTTVPAFAYDEKSLLTEVYLPDSITTLEEGSFRNCGTITTFRGNGLLNISACVSVGTTVLRYAAFHFTTVTDLIVHSISGIDCNGNSQIENIYTYIKAGMSFPLFSGSLYLADGTAEGFDPQYGVHKISGPSIKKLYFKDFITPHYTTTTQDFRVFGDMSSLTDIYVAFGAEKNMYFGAEGVDLAHVTIHYNAKVNFR